MFMLTTTYMVRIFLVDTLNFSFWSDAGEDAPDRYTVSFDGERYTGYWALCACIQRGKQGESEPISLSCNLSIFCSITGGHPVD